MMGIRRIDRTNVDIAALETLCAVYQTASISAAARMLDVNQSTISYTVERLRQTFEDPLFVRAGRGIVATERCHEIVRGFHEILEEFDSISRPLPFDPSEASFRVVFALDHKERIILMSRILRVLRRQAPKVKMQLLFGNPHGHARLRDGICDFLLSPDEHDSPTLYRKLLYRDSYVCIVDPDGPYARGITIGQYIEARHIIVSDEGMRRPPYVLWLERNGLRGLATLDLASTAEIDRYVLGTDLVATIPARLAEHYCGRVAIIKAPFDVKAETYMYWTSRIHRNESMRWIRDLVLKAAAQPGDLTACP